MRTDLNQELRPEISDLASRYIRELTDGRYSDIELDDQYNVIVLEDAIPKPVISGGEQDLANLVLHFVEFGGLRWFLTFENHYRDTIGG